MSALDETQMFGVINGLYLNNIDKDNELLYIIRSDKKTGWDQNLYLKCQIQNYSEIQNKSRYLPNVKDQKILFKLKSKKPIYPSEEEVQMNSPSRSAKLRYGIKLSHNSDFDDFIKKFQYLLDIENMSEKI